MKKKLKQVFPPFIGLVKREEFLLLDSVSLYYMFAVKKIFNDFNDVVILRTKDSKCFESLEKFDNDKSNKELLYKYKQ